MNPKEYYSYLLNLTGWQEFWPPPIGQPELVHMLATRAEESFSVLGNPVTRKEAILLAHRTFNGGPNSVLADLQAQLESFLTPEETSKINGIVFAGQFPTGDANACVLPVPKSGYLILVNFGLMQLIYRIMILVASRTTIRRLGWRVGPVRIPHPLTILKRFTHPVDVSDHIAKDHLVDLVRRYLAFRELGPFLLDSKPGRKRHMVATLTDAAERFLLAHEYGHIIADHFDTPLRQIITVQDLKIDVIPRTWDQEHEADRLGVALLMRPWFRARKQGFPRTFLERYANWWLSGPIVLLHILNMLERGESRGEWNHPPTSTRLERITGFIASEFPDVWLPHLLSSMLTGFLKVHL